MGAAHVNLLFQAVLVEAAEEISVNLACGYSEVICTLQPVVGGTAVSFGSPHDQHDDHVIGPAAT
jgi:hypothetical protein